MKEGRQKADRMSKRKGKSEAFMINYILRKHMEDECMCLSFLYTFPFVQSSVKILLIQH